MRELFNAWNDPNPEGEPDELDGAEAWLETETPEQPLEKGEVAFNYDEWDRELTDHRLGWCRVIEKRVKHGDRNFVEATRDRYKGVISSIRHQFQMMKPEDLKQVYLSFGNDLAVRNGEDSWTLPMPGRFVVDRNGIVRAVDVDPDYRYRPEPEKTVDDVRALK